MLRPRSAVSPVNRQFEWELLRQYNIGLFSVLLMVKHVIPLWLYHRHHKQRSRGFVGS